MLSKLPHSEAADQRKTSAPPIRSTGKAVTNVSPSTPGEQPGNRQDG
jgi:hypothetical protein